MTKKTVQRLARQFIQKHNLTPTVDLDKAARSINVAIIHVELPGDYTGVSIPPHKLSPLYDDIDQFVIGVNTRCSITHQRFTIAHEIGHIVLGHPQQSGPIFFSTIENYYLDGHPNEIDANTFAAELLMPTMHIKRIVFESCLRDVGSLCRLYQVSKAAMEIKLREIGLTN